MINRRFYNVTIDELQRYRNENPVKTYYHLPGTLKIHQVSNKLCNSLGIYRQDFSCCCAPCMEGQYANCKHALVAGVFTNDLSFIQPKFSVFKEKGAGLLLNLP